MIIIIVQNSCKQDYNNGEFQQIQTNQVTIDVWVPDYLFQYAIDTGHTDYGFRGISHHYGSGGDTIENFIYGKAELDTISFNIELPDVRYPPKDTSQLDLSYIDVLAERYNEINPDGYRTISKTQKSINGREFYFLEYTLPFEPKDKYHSLQGLVQVDSVVYSFIYSYYGKNFDVNRKDVYKIMSSIKITKNN